MGGGRETEPWLQKEKFSRVGEGEQARAQPWERLGEGDIRHSACAWRGCAPVTPACSSRALVALGCLWRQGLPQPSEVRSPRVGVQA